ncbi:phospholipid-binding protein MlaC [Paraglaciecola sp. L3A3]|uniref:MlaC/ttg2D family ABC transporter substrate-binding protein n=1 Tax=Paraglaciecola sp. L3A3 TaxID=2686358 RepID=UPI00131ECFAE|nr:ABC transporter substrate-binding protein [Paraglaciecola sp. L3A3]
MNTQLFKVFKNLSQAVFAILLFGLANSSFATEVNNPQLLLEKVTNTTFTRIDLEKQSIEANPEHLRTIIEQELMPYIDHKFAAFKVLGKQFKSVPKQQIPEYVEQFRQYLISNFAVALANYGGQELIFEPVKDSANAKSMAIKAIIRQAGYPDINIQFKLRKNSKTQEWKTYDLVAEGISLLSSKQTEFASLIRQQGIQAVIDVMKAKNSEPLELAKNSN